MIVYKMQFYLIVAKSDSATCHKKYIRETKTLFLKFNFQDIDNLYLKTLWEKCRNFLVLKKQTEKITAIFLTE